MLKFGFAVPILPDAGGQNDENIQAIKDIEGRLVWLTASACECVMISGLGSLLVVRCIPFWSDASHYSPSVMIGNPIGGCMYSYVVQERCTAVYRFQNEIILHTSKGIDVWSWFSRAILSESTLHCPGYPFSMYGGVQQRPIPCEKILALWLLQYEKNDILKSATMIGC